MPINIPRKLNRQTIKNPSSQLLPTSSTSLSVQIYLKQLKNKSQLTKMTSIQIPQCTTTTFLSLFLLTIISPPLLTTATTTTYNLINLGARSGCRADASKTLLKAWSLACNSENKATIYVPKGRFLVQNAITFSGYKCRSKQIKFQIAGTLVAPSDYNVNKNVEDVTWIMFRDVSGVVLSGGTLDGQGNGLWDCKNKRKGGCPRGITTIGFTGSSNIKIDGLTSLNSQLYHIVFNGCKNVKLKNIKILAPGNSPNTDGIHVQYSTGVTISNTKIMTGDDCVSIGAGTANLWIEGVKCGPGHGISIGSLGKQKNEPGVQNVTVKGVTFTGTQNGARIKSWGRPSNGFVRNVLFQHVKMVDVQNPIIIDQSYCPHNKGCPGKVSGIRISDVTYEDIHGTSATQVAVKFDCSSKFPCHNIRLRDVKLTFKDQPASASCEHVSSGSTSGYVVPDSCL